MTLNKLREQGNRFLGTSTSMKLLYLKVIQLFVSLVALATLTIYHGFPHSSQGDSNMMNVMAFSFGFYVVQYLIKLSCNIHPKKHFKATWLEAIVIVTIVTEVSSTILTGDLLITNLFEKYSISSGKDLSIIMVHGCFFLSTLIALVRKERCVALIKRHPAVVFSLSFLGLIFTGTLLLTMPEMTSSGSSMALLDAFFTSTSATCVTGLMVQDTMSFFAFKGQMVMLLLIQLGGLNAIALALVLARAMRSGNSVQQQNITEDATNLDTFQGGLATLRKVALWCFTIEALGALALGVVWSSAIPFSGLGDRIFLSVFHSVSAFNNSGITLYTDGFAHPWLATNWLVHWVISTLVFLGALGMFALFDMFEPARLRDRLRHPNKTIGFATKIALYVSMIVVVFGAVSFAILESKGVLFGMSNFGKLTTSIFQSVSRTAGFNSIDTSAISLPMSLIFIALMFVGSSNSSTGGGIKTSTFAVIGSDVWRKIRRFDHAQLFNRTVNATLRSKSYGVLIFFLVGNIVFLMILSITESSLLSGEKYNIIDLAFEQVSAMSNSGLSSGLTPFLSPAGKMTIATSMFVGRIGTLAAAFVIASNITDTYFKNPEDHTVVG
tara:strand:+ start:418 stop:2244 length:1827 start_codon:yes stop_codon:yes gene_type:complete